MEPPKTLEWIVEVPVLLNEQFFGTARFKVDKDSMKVYSTNYLEYDYPPIMTEADLEQRGLTASLVFVNGSSWGLELKPKDPS